MEHQLAAIEVYLTAKVEMRKSERWRLLAETRLLLQEIVKSCFASSAGDVINKN
jgi:hypothetical protein